MRDMKFSMVIFMTGFSLISTVSSTLEGMALQLQPASLQLHADLVPMLIHVPAEDKILVSCKHCRPSLTLWWRQLIGHGVSEPGEDVPLVLSAVNREKKPQKQLSFIHVHNRLSTLKEKPRVLNSPSNFLFLSIFLRRRRKSFFILVRISLISTD